MTIVSTTYLKSESANTKTTKRAKPVSAFVISKCWYTTFENMFLLSEYSPVLKGIQKYIKEKKDNYPFLFMVEYDNLMDCSVNSCQH